MILLQWNQFQITALHYRIKKKSLDLIWSDVTRDNLLNLIEIGDYTVDEITHFIDDSVENIRIELNSLFLDDPPLHQICYDK